MDKQNLIKLLEKYRQDALNNMFREARVEALLRIPPEFSEKLNDMSIRLKELHNDSCTLSKAFSETPIGIQMLGGKPYADYHRNGILYDVIHRLRIDITEDVVNDVIYHIRNTNHYQTRKDEITSKFNSAITKAKRLNNPKSLTELANLLNISIDEEITVPVKTSGIDVPFLKSEISKVLSIE